MKPFLNQALIVRDEEFGCIIHGISKGLLYVLNNTGKDILDLCNGRNTVDQIILKIMKRYNCAVDTKPDLEQFIKGLLNNGLIVTHQKSSSKASVAPTQGGLSIFEGFESNPLAHTTLSAPIVIYWEITSQCNLKCIHCYNNSSPKLLKRELDTKEIKKIINQLAKQKVFWLAITGGEALFKKDIFEILKYAHSKKICTMLSTNGTILTNEKAQKIKAAGVSSVQVSIDGIESMHDEFRGQKGAFEKAVNAVKLLVKHKIPDVTISSVATKLNFNEIPKIIDLAVKINASRYRIITLMPAGRAKNNIAKLWLTTKDKLELKELLQKKSAEYNGKIVISQEEGSFNLLNESFSKNPVPLGCAAARSICKISPNGDVYPCSYFTDKQTVAGNLRKKRFEKIWKTATIFKKLRTIKHIKGECAKCKKLKYCGGGCRAAAYNYSNDLYAENPECLMVTK